MYNNPTAVAPANNVGLPHAIRVVLLRATGAATPTDEEIAVVIQANRPAGTDTDGLIVVELEDANGDPEDIRRDDATPLYVHLLITVTTGENWDPTGDPEEAVAQAVAVAGRALFSIGDDVERFQLHDAINALGGVKNATIEAGTTALPSDPTPPLVAADVVIGPDEVAVFDSGRIEVVIV